MSTKTFIWIAVIALVLLLSPIILMFISSLVFMIRDEIVRKPISSENLPWVSASKKVKGFEMYNSFTRDHREYWKIEGKRIAPETLINRSFKYLYDSSFLNEWKRPNELIMPVDENGITIDQSDIPYTCYLISVNPTVILLYGRNVPKLHRKGLKEINSNYIDSAVTVATVVPYATQILWFSPELHTLPSLLEHHEIKKPGIHLVFEQHGKTFKTCRKE